MPEFARSLRLLSAADNRHLLTGIKRGIEKESLRVSPDGKLALSPHPTGLGSALTHPRITTDYSEALVELITPPSSSTPEIISILEDVHNFTYRHIGDELLWVHSMPCVLGDDESIPVATYGQSNVGRMKTIYRLGLGHRYGRLMQTIAGIHYNWSMPDQFWGLLQSVDSRSLGHQDFKTQRYFDLIRNFRRRTWLLLYLFGAAPAVCPSFVTGRDHELEPFEGKNHSLHAPYGTSLRMGDLGYQSDAQSKLVICYNDLQSYMDTLREGLSIPYPPYDARGIRDADGHYQQLNTNLLQIENEFYSTIRPKRTTHTGEAPLKALGERGVEYVEVRCLDLNPFMPLGIDATQMYFLDIFLLYCLLDTSPDTDEEENGHIRNNQRATVYRGRDPALTLIRDGESISARAWGRDMFAAMAPIAELLDNAHGSDDYSATLDEMRQRLDRPELTPSARILAAMKRDDISYFQLALRHARETRDYFRHRPLDPDTEAFYRRMSATSVADQQTIENNDSLSLDDFLADYYRQHAL